jgi:hypothetical protein
VSPLNRPKPAVKYTPQPLTTTGALGVLFLYLDLTGKVDWPLWLVLLPWYIGLILAGLWLAVGYVVFAVADALDRRAARRRAAATQARRNEAQARMRDYREAHPTPTSNPYRKL